MITMSHDWATPLTLAVSDRGIVLHIDHEDMKEGAFGGRVSHVELVAGKGPDFKSASTCSRQ